jgi:uncharacterized protein
MICQSCGTLIEGPNNFCPHCGASVTKFDESLHLQSSSDKKTSSKIYFWGVRIGILLVFLAGIGYFFATIERNYHPVIGEQPSIGSAALSSTAKIVSYKTTAVIDDTDDIVVPIKILMDYRIIRFADPEGKQKVPILAYLTPSGKVVTAMSLSETCRSDDFYLEGENIHCANCPSYWNMESMEAYACCQKYYPDPIPSTIIGDNLVVKKSVVQNWRVRL